MRGMRLLAAVTALVLFLGLHWAVLQTVAWTGMLLDYSRSGSIGRAISMTFDGRNPCALCLAIRHGRQTQEKESPPELRARAKLECDLPTGPLVVHRGAPGVLPPARAAVGPSRTDAPPKPRPRRSTAA